MFNRSTSASLLITAHIKLISDALYDVGKHNPPSWYDEQLALEIRVPIIDTLI